LYFTKDVDQHHTKIDQQQFVRLLREIFKLPSPLTREKAFEFFAKLNQKSTLPQPRLPNF
jgi:hypothetical protein